MHRDSGFDLSGLINDIFGRSLRAIAGKQSDERYRTSSTDDGLIIDIDLPGVDPRSVTAWVTRSQVIVKGSGATAFTHRYTISSEYDTRCAEASMENGVLRVRLKRHPNDEPRRISVEYARR